jgi:hypothetical protein
MFWCGRYSWSGLFEINLIAVGSICVSLCKAKFSFLSCIITFRDATFLRKLFSGWVKKATKISIFLLPPSFVHFLISEKRQLKRGYAGRVME